MTIIGECIFIQGLDERMEKNSFDLADDRIVFSIIIPAYNSAKFIKRSVGSVIKQTYEKYEAIIINDGSTDDTKSVIKQITDSRVRLINQENRGVSVARNRGLQEAQGQYICFLDSDDEYFDNHLEVLKNMIDQYPEKSFFSTRHCVSKIGNASEVEMPRVTNEIAFYSNFVDEILKEPEKICTGSVCIHRSMFDKYGIFQAGVKLGEDTDMWKRVYVHSGVVFGDYVTVKVNRDGSEATKVYSRRFEVDPMNRMELFLNDATIANDVKDSLVVENEYIKLQVVRSNILVGRKKKAWNKLKYVNKRLVPAKRILVTMVCFLVPESLLMFIMNQRNSGKFEKR